MPVHVYTGTVLPRAGKTRRIFLYHRHRTADSRRRAASLRSSYGKQKVFEAGLEEGRARHARNEARNIAKRWLRKVKSAPASKPSPSDFPKPDARAPSLRAQKGCPQEQPPIISTDATPFHAALQDSSDAPVRLRETTVAGHHPLPEHGDTEDQTVRDDKNLVADERAVGHESARRQNLASEQTP